MMSSTVEYSRFSAFSTDGRGVKSYEDPIKVQCRIQPTRRLVKDLSGREVVASITVIMAPFSTAGSSDVIKVGVSDRIELPAGLQVAGSSQPPIISSYVVQDEQGLHHSTVII